MLARWWHAAIAVLVFGAVVAQLAIAVRVPVAMIGGWLAFGPRPRISRVTVILSLLFPVLWLAYTLVRGAIWRWYPYPFLDVASHGYARVALNAAVVTIVFAAVAALFALADRRLPAAPRITPARGQAGAVAGADAGMQG